MPARITPLVNGQIYHIYNRGVEKRRVFEDRRCYKRLLHAIKYYQLKGPKPKFSHSFNNSLFKPNAEKKIVDIICYCLMPNHFHLLVKQLFDGGISEFVGKLINSYTKFYNVKYKRIGPLFQGQFKAVLIESEEQLIQIISSITVNHYLENGNKRTAVSAGVLYLLSYAVECINKEDTSNWVIEKMQHLKKIADSFAKAGNNFENVKDEMIKFAKYEIFT